MSEQSFSVGIVASVSAGADVTLRKHVEEFRAMGVPVEVRVAWEASQNAEIVERFVDAGHTLIVAAGGDGTINAVVESVVRQGADCEVGALAFGTANDFLTNLGLEKDLLSGILRRDSKPTDIVRLASHDRIVVNVATGGFGAEITASTDPTLKSTLGGLAYVLSGIGRLAELEPFELQLAADDYEWSGQTLGFAVGNGKQTGGGFEVCAKAALDDGLLDVCIAPQTARDSFKSYVVEGLTESSNVIYRQAKRVQIRTSREVHVNLDGEPVAGDEFEFEIVPGGVALRR